jgi:hypothetical protein
MRICIVGKFPPIQGGVAVRTFAYAHGLAARGHQVHVVTNADEVRPPYRVFMRPEDSSLCEAEYGSGLVKLHSTEPVDRSQHHIPMASPFVTKLASLALEVCASEAIEVIFSFYMEPYGIAGHLASLSLGIPHVVRTAGSDAGEAARRAAVAEDRMDPWRIHLNDLLDVAQPDTLRAIHDAMDNETRVRGRSEAVVALAAFGNGDRGERIKEELDGLRCDAERTGFIPQLEALSEALATMGDSA